MKRCDFWPNHKTQFYLITLKYESVLILPSFVVLLLLCPKIWKVSCIFWFNNWRYLATKMDFGVIELSIEYWMLDMDIQYWTFDCGYWMLQSATFWSSVIGRVGLWQHNLGQLVDVMWQCWWWSRISWILNILLWILNILAICYFLPLCNQGGWHVTRQPGAIGDHSKVDGTWRCWRWWWRCCCYCWCHSELSCEGLSLIFSTAGALVVVTV